MTTDSRLFVCDIETGPGDESLIRQIMPPYEAKKHPGEFNPAAVKYGNAKDPAKRADILAAAQEKHAKAIADYEAELVSEEASYWADVMSKAALSALTGRVLAIGVRDAANCRDMVICDDDEEQLLTRFWKFVSNVTEYRHSVAGWNTHGFDWPFICQRSAILGLDVPPLITRGRYFPDWSIDLMERWTVGQRGASAKLDTVARAMGFAGKNGNGADFAKLWESDRPQAVEYLKNDLLMTANVAERMGYR